MVLRRARSAAPGGNGLGNLKLHFDDAPEDIIPFPGRPVPAKPLRFRGEAGGIDDPVRAAEEALDRMSRQLANLRDLLGQDLGLPDSPRAA
ncbi:hypothetical protein PHYC_00827 [Phycisphaerales bacterium]|nr:hypothetical protein PHYC_00827 [Phycisphaerales bacterium]